MACRIWKYIGLKKECPNCNKIFEPKRNKKKVKYCSLKCSYEHRKVGWNSKRKKALKKAGYKCEKCGNTERLNVHHKEKAVYGKGHGPLKESNNSLSNLIVLCAKCHMKEHGVGVKRFTGKGICLSCGKKFTYYPKSNRGKYCSRKCAYENSNLKLVPIACICIQCGLEFQGLKKSKFCSNKCKSRWHYANKKREK